MMRKGISITTLLVLALQGAGQYHTDPESIFKMQLFLDRSNVAMLQADSSIVKNDSLYRAFFEKTELPLQPLPIVDDYLTDLSGHDFRFYRVDLDSVRTHGTAGDGGQYIGLFSGQFNEYTLAIDMVTGRSFKLGGFDQNDLHGFLDAISEAYESTYQSRFSRKRFLKDYHVAGLHFKCLLRGLHQQKRDTNKFPCLRRVSDPVVSHG